MASEHPTRSAIQEYYGRILQSKNDLRTSACCSIDTMPEPVRRIVPELHPEVKDKFYGCGSPVPPALEGKTVLDLGSGSGRDCFLLSKLVGPEGRVIGVDMTAEQLAVANRHIGYHTEKFGYREPNVQFLQGYIEDLGSLGLGSDSIDVVVSNCVINLSPAKPQVFSEIFRVLKPGGELFFSDVFADRRIPPNLAGDPVLLGECLGGAFYIEDFRRLLGQLGCLDFRVVNRSRITLDDLDIERKAGMVAFYSTTIRSFKLNLEDRCEDYGQVAYYQGTLPDHPHAFMLDDHHVFHTGRPMLVCGNTAAMLSHTRYADHFRVMGDTDTHYGLFDCGSPGAPAGPTGEMLPGGCC